LIQNLVSTITNEIIFPRHRPFCIVISIFIFSIPPHILDIAGFALIPISILSVSVSLSAPLPHGPRRGSITPVSNENPAPSVAMFFFFFLFFLFLFLFLLSLLFLFVTPVLHPHQLPSCPQPLRRKPTSQCSCGRHARADAHTQSVAAIAFQILRFGLGS